VCLSGTRSARAQDARADALSARTDSLTSAFFLLKYDYDLLKARSEGTAELDSLRVAQTISFWSARVEDEKAMRYRGYVMIGVAFLLAGVAIYAGSKIE